MSTPSKMSVSVALTLTRRTTRFCQTLPSAVDCSSRSFKSGTRDLNVETAASEKYRTIDDLSGPSLATTVYWLFVKGYADKSHAMQVEHRRLYGPIWRSRFGPFDIVNVATPELIAQVIRQEGRYPVRTLLSHWKEYRDLRGQAYGLHVDTGPEWFRLRSALNPKMLKPQEVKVFVPLIQAVVSDLLARLETLRVRSPDGTTVPDIAAELYKFGFEGISSVLFETRLGCLQEEIPADTLRFIAATSAMLRLSETVLFLPHWTRAVLPFWRQFVQAWDDLYDVAQRLIDQKVEELQCREEARGEEARGVYLTYLLSSGRLTKEEVYITITELLLGGVDTTSNTLSWTLYHLARDSGVQERLRQEVASVCPGKRVPTADDLTHMPYLKAVIKETLRLYPVVPGNGRVTLENEVVVDNYWFPKKTQFHLCHYAASHDEAEFPEAERFIPSRWLRGAPSRSQHHPYSSVPFGVGIRACVGKRLAELEMYFALSQIMQHYHVRPCEGASVVQPKTRTLLIPSQPINLRFLPIA
ncbi:sterol 26-hydroxylase, mitochondrial isoform X2 [Clupea harengus]|uniref:Sterol 26-hydroxylase, mitochondrial isoform X2 n=1 Tax=Clupea harengus TaxID=7950 RepID=A0A8M1K4N3_CLUHA|nr:sterol 26-hydroxylase, mitochondrial isoform X2 [Clupea harengus]